MTLVTPGNAKSPVPVMIMFSSAAIRQFIASHPEFKKMMGSDPPSTEQLIAGGWGYALLDTSTIQADNGAGLTKGIIGLTNKGQARKPEDWGALRAWGWGASRGLDYLQTDKSADAKRVGIEGVSRYGKAALVTMAFDTRFAAVLVGSSGEGAVFRLLGAKGVGVNEYYQKAKMPPVNTGLLDGQRAWRQHDAGHTDAPN